MVTIKEIPPEEADRICRDVQLWWKWYEWGDSWIAETYRKGGKKMPSTWSVMYGIGVELDKPEYTTEHVKCDHEHPSNEVATTRCDHG